ncbi:MAG: hypothetical protein L3K08_09105, partial [Thermoplasmata archaeon]|nr:hypothetical protein [Thermoplasmata archaeon]
MHRPFDLRLRRFRAVPAGFAILSMVPFILGSLGGGSAAPIGPGEASHAVSERSTPSATNLPLALGTSTAPTVICAGGADICPVAVPESRVQLTANTLGNPAVSWPDVQVVF